MLRINKTIMLICLLGITVGTTLGQANVGPCDPQATPKTKALYRNLKALSGKAVMFGHQDTLAYGIGWKGQGFDSDVYRTSGKFPAVFGWDLGHIGQPNNIDGVPFERIRAWIKEVYSKGGLNTISWHARVPGTMMSAWTRQKVVPRILPDGDLHDAFCADLDLVAAFMLSLKAPDGEYVPVVFRPFHEHNGSWFWWGADNCTVEQYKQLWRFTIGYLRQKGVHNLISCYSTDVFQSTDEYLERYPGDDLVDILGFDDYQTVRSGSAQDRTRWQIETVVELAEAKGKIAAWTETGLERLGQADWWTKVLLANLKASDKTSRIVWILVWRNGRPDHFYAPYPGQSSADDFRKFEQDPLTFFLEDLRGLYD